MTLEKTYRPDIDGLRAFAVLAVLIFHAFPSALPGGFVGVDIFFVISGYLITSILLKELASASFSLTHFYNKRIQRIFPALLVVLTFCLWVGWVTLTPIEYKQLGRYTAGGAAFLNNFLFWRDAGYFDSEATTKPLLHLWSLAIEEQFYLVWPILLWLCHLVSRQAFVKAIAIGVIFWGSLCLSYIWVQRDITADFYSPLSRSWELAMGAALAYAHLHPYRLFQNVDITHRLRHALSMIGLALLVMALVLINSTDAFPGLWALLPTIGAACLIAAGAKACINRLVLSSRPLVWIGLISYPLYLWHWPLLTFARIFEGQTPSPTARAGLLLASLVLAALTYLLIERPIRFPTMHPPQKPANLAHGSWRKKAVVTCLGLGMIVVFALGYTITRSNGLPWRHTDRLNADLHTIALGADRQLLRHACGLSPEQASAFEWCLSQNKPTPAQFAVIGDSKAEALYYGLARESAADQNWLLMGSFPAFKLPQNNEGALLKKALQRLEADSHIRTVVLANSFRHIFATDNVTRLINKQYSKADIHRLAQEQNELAQHLQRAGKQVVFVIDNPTLPDPTSCVQGEMTSLPLLRSILTRTANPHCQIGYQAHLAGTWAYQQFSQELQRINPRLIVFNPLPLLCDVSGDRCTYHEGRNFLYSYGDHLSDYANSKIAKKLLLILQP